MMGRVVLLLRNLCLLNRLASYSIENWSTKCPESYFLLSLVGCDATKICIIPGYVSKDTACRKES